MFRCAICNETWGALLFAQVCAQIAAAGYDGVEIAPFTLARQFNKPANALTPGERAGLRRTAEEAGLEIVGLHWLLVPPPDGLHLTTGNAVVRARTADYLRGLADLCADLGGSVLVLGSPQQRSVPLGEEAAVARARFVEAIMPCLDACQERGVRLCLEPLGPGETNFLNTLSEARTLIRATSDHPACRTIFDVKAAATENAPFATLIRDNADLIAHVHANDVNRRGPGFGDTNFAPLLQALARAGYEGWISVEVFDYSPDPDTIARVSRETLRGAMEKIW